MKIVFHKKYADSNVYYARDIENDINTIYRIQDVIGLPRNKTYKYKTCKITPMNIKNANFSKVIICENVPYEVKRSLAYYTHVADARRYVNYELNEENYCC